MLRCAKIFIVAALSFCLTGGNLVSEENLSLSKECHSLKKRHCCKKNHHKKVPITTTTFIFHSDEPFLITGPDALGTVIVTAAIEEVATATDGKQYVIDRTVSAKQEVMFTSSTIVPPISLNVTGPLNGVVDVTFGIDLPSGTIAINTGDILINAAQNPKTQIVIAGPGVKFNDFTTSIPANLNIAVVRGVALDF